MADATVYKFIDGDAYVWIEQEASIMLKAVTASGDPVELAWDDAQEIGRLLIRLAYEGERLSLPPPCKGEIVSVGGKVGVVVLTGKDLDGDLEDHTGVWFGSLENGRPEVWTIPTEYLSKGSEPIFKH